MKNSLSAWFVPAGIASLALAAAPAAMAQSSVTLWGIVDATLAYGKGSIANRTQLTNSGYNSSRLGFRGVEDLGGGMTASFWLEASVNNDNGTGTATNVNNQASGGGATGTCTVAGAAPAAAGGTVTCATAVSPNGTQGLTFNRRSTVSLAGGWGELRLGRDYTPQFWNISVFDPFGANGVGTNQTLNSIITGVTAVRSSNSIGYFLPPNIGGIYGQVQYYMGENLQTGAATEDDGQGLAMRVGYASGPFNAALALSRTKYAAGDVEQNNIGGSWDLGVAKLMGEYSRDRNGTARGKGALIGATVPVGVGEVRASYSRYRTNVATSPTAKKFSIGYVHNLSKRTALYATAARLSNSGASAQALNGAVTAAGGSSNGYDIGVRHSF